MSTKQFRSHFTHAMELPLRLIIILSMLISALMLPLGTVSAVASNRKMCSSDGYFTNLVGCWRLDEGTGTTIQDGGTTPYNDNTASGGAPAWYTDPTRGIVASFNGSSYYSIPDEASLNPGPTPNQITIAAWFYPKAITTQHVIKKLSGSAGYELSLSSSTASPAQKIFFRINNDTTNLRINSTTTYPNDSAWIHAVATYNGTTMNLYVNGVLEATKTYTATIGTNTSPLTIGAYASANYYTGYLDNVLIYNRALNATEALALYTTPPGDTTASAAPTGLSAVPGDTTVALSWDEMTLPHDVKGWNVYRSESSPVDTGTPLQYVTSESYNDTSVSNGTLYYYTVKAVDTSNNLSDPADEASATPNATCYALTLNSGANGSAPTADPDRSTGCPAGEYKAGEAITLTAHPDTDYEVDTWTGTDNDTLKTLENSLTMPANIHTATVTYTAAVNDAPVVADIPNQTIDEGASFTTINLDSYVSDVDNNDDEMDWIYSGNIELSVDIDGSRIATITTPDSDWSGSETITFTATDPGDLSDSDDATFTVTAVNDAPEVSNPGNQSSAEGDVISLQITATDVDGPALEYSALELPEGLGIDPDTGLVSGTISYIAAADSPYSSSVTVTDGTTPVTVYFTWTVAQTAFGACAGETGLVGCWQMEEGSGSAIYDGSSLGNDGTTTGGPTWVTGKIDAWALSLNGTTQSASVPDDDSLDLTDAFTIAGWIQPGKSATQDLFKKADMGNTDGFEIGLATSTKVLFRINQDTYADLYRINSITSYPIDGTWMHVAATYSDGTMKLYINGVQEGGDKAAPAPAVNTLPFTLGTQATSPRYYQGAMDDVRLYDRALNLEEIQVLAGLNIAPVVTDIPDQTIAEGDSFVTINLDDYVSDVDNTDADMTWTYTGDTDLNVSIVDRVATITTPHADWYGSETITFRATDPGALYDEDAATFAVTGVNDAPVVADIPGQTIAEGDNFTTISLDDYVSDSDNADTEMTWTFSGNTALLVNIVNRVASITTPDGDWSGFETITFRATDPGALYDEDSATFTVTVVNDAPVVTDIPDQTIAEGDSFVSISLDDYVSDADNTDAEMTWSYYGETDLNVSIVNRIATITTPDAEWTGSEVITFRATDPGTLYDEDVATFTVTGLNDAPVVADIPGQIIAEGDSFVTISLDDYVSDADNTDAEMTWTHSGDESLSVSIVARVATITTPHSNWSGSESITFRATDPGFLFDEDAATFTVTAVNDAPVVTDIPGQTIAEGGSFVTISLDDYVSDVDNTDAEMTWSYYGETDLNVSIVNRIATITAPDPDWNGSEAITFRATDPGLLYGEDAATFTVTAVNDAPVVTDIPGQTIVEGDSFATISLDDYVSDVDNSDTQITWTFSGNTDLSVDIDGNRVATITTPSVDWSGSETITFRATDPGAFYDEDAATFTVTPMDESTALVYVQDNTSLTGSLSALTATFPPRIPPVLVAEDYTINSRMTLGQALPTGTTVSILITVNGVGPFPYITDELVPGTTFWITDLAGGPAADFDAGYGGRIELYSISINSGGGNPLAIDTTVLIESIISKDGFVTPVILADITLPIHIDADEEAALAYVQDNTSLTGSLSALTATFPPSIPPVLVAEDYTINSRMTLGQALPTGTTVSILITVNGVGPTPYITDKLVPGTTFWITDLAGGPAAAFDAGYGGRIELYSISINSGGGNLFPIDTTVLIESIISKDGFVTPVILADITLPIHIDADNEVPVMTDIPDQTIDEGDNFVTISLDDFVSDADHSDAELAWSYSGNAELNVSIVDRVATITTPNPDWNNSETITFRATDPGLLYDEDAASFTVTAVNDAPVLEPIGSKSTDELVLLEFTATASDIDLPGDILIFSLANGTGGSVPDGAGIGPSSGDFSWTPTETQGPGIYTFDVCVSDGALSDCETISVTVNEVATAPIAVPDAYEVLVNGTLMVSAPGVLANDSDADIPTNILEAVLDTDTTHGDLVLNPDGSFTYTPDPMWSGIDSFTYRVFDGTGYSEVVSVTITVKMKFYLPMVLR